MNRWRVREDRGSKEKDQCPLTPSHKPATAVARPVTSAKSAASITMSAT
jgi:hypothetical protein